MTEYSQHVGGRFKAFGVIQETFELADFVDQTDTDGIATFADSLPAGAIVHSIGLEVTEGFTGTAAVTAALAVAAGTFGAGGLVMTTAGTVGQTDATPPAIAATAQELTLVASDTVDWGVVVTGGTGEVTARVIYMQVASVSGR